MAMTTDPGQFDYLNDPDYFNFDRVWRLLGGDVVPVDDVGIPTSSRTRINIPDNVRPDTMLRLEAAAALGFPDGSMSVAALRREAAAGHLTVYRIAGKHFTTLNDIEGLKAICRVDPKDQDSLSSKPKAAPPSGISGTDKGPSARDALKATAQRLKENLASTSSASTTPKQAGAVVIPIGSKSPTR
jgi:hypothetical protein